MLSYLIRFLCALQLVRGLLPARPPLLARMQASLERHQNCEENCEQDASRLYDDEEGAQTATPDGERYLPHGSPRCKLPLIYRNMRKAVYRSLPLHQAVNSVLKIIEGSETRHVFSRRPTSLASAVTTVFLSHIFSILLFEFFCPRPNFLHTVVLPGVTRNHRKEQHFSNYAPARPEPTIISCGERRSTVTLNSQRSLFGVLLPVWSNCGPPTCDFVPVRPASHF